MTAKAAISVVAVALLLVPLYHDVWRHLLSNWMSSEGSHGPVLLAVSLYLVWLKIKENQGMPARPALFSGTLIATMGFFMLFAGKISSTMLIQQISMIPVILGIIYLLLGFQWEKAFSVPVGYLVFLTGLLEEILGSFSIHLQVTTAWLASKFLQLIGIPVFRSGTVIEMPHIALEVIRECNGINHIIALMALAVPLAYMGHRTTLQKAALVFSALLIGIFANGARVAIIGIYAIFDSGAQLHGPYGALYVSFIFFFGMIVLVLLARVMRCSNEVVQTVGAPTSQSIMEGATTIGSNGGNTSIPGTGRLYAWCLVSALCGMTFVSLHWFTIRPVDPQRPLHLFPNHIAGFSGAGTDGSHERIRPFEADNELIESYQDSDGNQVLLYIGYFASQNRRSKIVDYRRDWMHDGAVTISLPSDRGNAIIGKNTMRTGNDEHTIYFWYLLLDGKIISSRYIGKSATFWDALIRRKTNGAVVVIQTRAKEPTVLPFIQEAVHVTKAYLYAPSE